MAGKKNPPTIGDDSVLTDLKLQFTKSFLTLNIDKKDIVNQELYRRNEGQYERNASAYDSDGPTFRWNNPTA